MSTERWSVRWTTFGCVGWRVFKAADRADALDAARRRYRGAKRSGEHVGLAIRVERERDGETVVVFNEDSLEVRDGTEPKPKADVMIHAGSQSIPRGYLVCMARHAVGRGAEAWDWLTAQGWTRTPEEIAQHAESLRLARTVLDDFDALYDERGELR